MTNTTNNSYTTQSLMNATVTLNIVMTKSWHTIQNHFVIHTIWLILVVFSVIFYIYLMVMLYTHRKKTPFNSSFFALWIAMGVADLTFTVIVRLNFEMYQCLCSKFVLFPRQNLTTHALFEISVLVLFRHRWGTDLRHIYCR